MIEADVLSISLLSFFALLKGGDGSQRERERERGRGLSLWLLVLRVALPTPIQAELVEGVGSDPSLKRGAAMQQRT